MKINVDKKQTGHYSKKIYPLLRSIRRLLFDFPFRFAL